MAGASPPRSPDPAVDANARPLVEIRGPTLRVTVTWSRRTDGRQQVSTFEREVGG